MSRAISSVSSSAPMGETTPATAPLLLGTLPPLPLATTLPFTTTLPLATTLPLTTTLPLATTPQLTTTPKHSDLRPAEAPSRALATAPTHAARRAEPADFRPREDGGAARRVPAAAAPDLIV